MPASLSPIERAKILETKDRPLGTVRVFDSWVAFAGKTDHITNRLFTAGSENAFRELLDQARVLLKTGQ